VAFIGLRLAVLLSVIAAYAYSLDPAGNQTGVTDASRLQL